MSGILKAIAGVSPEPWLFWTIIVIVGFWIALPRIEELLPWERFSRRERARLELTKLHFEIEAIKKQHGLEEYESPYSDFSVPETEQGMAEEIVEVAEQLPGMDTSKSTSGDIGAQEAEQKDLRGGVRIPSPATSLMRTITLGAVGGAVVGLVIILQVATTSASVLEHRFGFMALSLVFIFLGASAAFLSRSSGARAAFAVGLLAALGVVQLISTVYRDRPEVKPAIFHLVPSDGMMR